MKLKLLFALLVFQCSFAQQRSCGTKEYMQELMANPARYQQHIAQQALFETRLQEQNSNREASNVNVVIRIPVAVHFPAGNNLFRPCLVALAQSQVDILNADFNGTNADIALWGAASAFYPGVSTGNFEVQFELATQNHPAGTDPNLLNGQPAVTIGYNFGNGGDSDSTWDGYLNFLVKNIGNGLLGYSPLGGLPVNGDAVVMNTFAFGSGSGCNGFVPGAPFDLGRTVTHELGHFFNLDHTFGNGNGCNFANTDFVADTPQVGFESYNCPANGGVNGCVAGQKALTMNYMDYVDDACMFMFTTGQGQRAVAYINTIASQFNTNVLSTKSVVNTPFSIYPNPNNGSFTIQFKEFVSEYSVTVYDSLGRKVYANDFKQTSEIFQTINLDTIQKGVYLVSVSKDNATTTSKIVVE